VSNKHDLIEIYLVPGFLGFESVGKLQYFIDVDLALEKNLGGPNVELRIHATETEPAASFHRRAVKLAKEVASKHSPDATSVHFVGHSTGGIDIRVLLSEGGAIDQDPTLDGELSEDSAHNLRDALSKTQSAVGVATPHYGSPIASAALRLDVDLLLQALSKILRFGPAGFVLSNTLVIAGLATTIVRGLPGDKPFIEWLGRDVLSHPPKELIEYLRHVTKDVGALRNLTQEGTNLANALLIDRKGVRYGSIVTGTQEPHGLIETTYPIIYFNTMIFRLVWDIVAKRNPGYPYAERNPELERKQAADRDNDLDVGELNIDDRTNDGIVPTASQAHGEILGVFESDHLDCVGHYPHDRPHRPTKEHVPGWIRSGAAFNGKRFDLLWQRVAEFIAR
jgi:hypothetical protein